MDKKTDSRFGLPISLLGFGCMRFPMIDEVVIEEEAGAMLERAYQAGVNYFDTAYVYHNGTSEGILAKYIVDRQPRESFYIADKLPGWKLPEKATIDDMRRVFAEHLERLHTDYIDFYLVHSLNKGRWQKLVAEGVLDFLDELRAQGKVRYVGFSFHDKAAEIDAIIAAYDWDFCQLQLNYYDWLEQDARYQYQRASEAGLAVISMEPVRGGMLTELPEQALAILEAARPGATPASWAFRWVASLENVLVTLSGMTKMEQLAENLQIFSDFQPLSAAEQQALSEALEIIRARKITPCTSCKYCTEVCPVRLDIPGAIQAHNNYRQFGNQSTIHNYLRLLPKEGYPSLCQQCGLCAEACPQQIDIPQEMLGLAELVNNFISAGR